MPRCHEGNAFPDKRRHDGDNELVNRVLVKEGPDDLTSAHHPNVLASLLAEALGKGPDRLPDELDAGRHGCRRLPAREYIMHVICAEAGAHLHAQVEGLATENLGIDGARKFRQTVEPLWSRPSGQPIEIAIGSSDVAVRARRNIDDDFSLWHHRSLVRLGSPDWSSDLFVVHCAHSDEQTQIACKAAVAALRGGLGTHRDAGFTPHCRGFHQTASGVLFTKAENIAVRILD